MANKERLEGSVSGLEEVKKKEEDALEEEMKGREDTVRSSSLSFSGLADFRCIVVRRKKEETSCRD